jgi:hypothetical protein
VPDQDCCQLFVPNPATKARFDSGDAETHFDVQEMVAQGLAQSADEEFTFPL